MSTNNILSSNIQLFISHISLFNRLDFSSNFHEGLNTLEYLISNHGERKGLTDLDSDGDRDALLVGIHQAAIWWNDGKGIFSDPGQRLDYTERHGLTLGDFDGDGDLDAIAIASDDEQILWLNEGDGRLSRSSASSNSRYLLRYPGFAAA